MTIEARRVTEQEADDFVVGKVELIDGRLVARSGLELFVGVKEFEEFRARIDRGEDGFREEEGIFEQAPSGSQARSFALFDRHQSSQFPADTFSARMFPMPREPRPVELESCSMPTNNSLWRDEDQSSCEGSSFR
jgi:hypothetical protein